ncbi:MAG: hypothetical protein ACKO66_06405, partial [Flavobacteriales bacterium]
MEERINPSDPKRDQDISALLFRYLRNWKLFFLCITFAVGCAFVYLRYQVNMFEAHATILI